MKPYWGIVTDEVCDDPLQALEAVADWGLYSVELRGCGKGRRVPDLEQNEAEAILSRAAQLDLQISALSPGTWKCGVRDAEAAEQALRYSRTLDLAECLGVKRIITFAVKRSPTDDAVTYNQVLERLGQMSQEADRRGLILCIENERGWWADTEDAILTLLRDLSHTGLSLNFDAGNFVDAGGIACPRTFRRLLPWIENIHLKDVCVQGNVHRWCLMGEGQVGWEKLLPAILGSTRQIPMSIETHCTPLLENSLKNRCYLRRFEF
jgi:sugar phosphate isomerase/epimerase